EKEEPRDFVLWKAPKDVREPRWPAPFGEGRPGWHLECSAMAIKYLGETLDLHCGGIDLLFPHHENEIAQSEAATGHPFVRFWVHNGSVKVGGVKMSKSLGNGITVTQALERWPGDVLRLFLLGSHYRSSTDFTPEAVDAAARG